MERRGPHPIAVLGTAIAVAVGLSLGCRHPDPAPPPVTPPAAGALATPAAAAPAVDGRAALERALVFLQRDGAWWMAGGKDVPGGGGCVSCHHVGFALWSHREARRATVAFDQPRIDALEQRAHRFYVERPSKGEPFARSQLLLGPGFATGAKDGGGPRWTAIQQRLLEEQEDEGHWEAAGQFPSQKRPEAESDAVATMWILVALGSFPTLEPAAVAARDRAFAWLKQSPTGVSNEWLAARLLVERQLGATAAADQLRERLLSQQHPDGGWSWLAADPSNAFSTGQSLHALAVDGANANHPALRRGIAYLLANQNADGTWTVDSALISNKGGEKIRYIYKYWGTAWAALGLARTLAPAQANATTSSPPAAPPGRRAHTAPPGPGSGGRQPPGRR